MAVGWTFGGRYFGLFDLAHVRILLWLGSHFSSERDQWFVKKGEIFEPVGQAEMQGMVVKEAKAEVEGRAQDIARVAMADREVRVPMVAMAAVLGL